MVCFDLPNKKAKLAALSGGWKVEELDKAWTFGGRLGFEKKHDEREKL